MATKKKPIKKAPAQKKKAVTRKTAAPARTVARKIPAKKAVQARAAKAPATSLQHEIEQFLYAQSELLDNKRSQAWMDLFTPDGVYWAPTDSADKHWEGRPAIFIEDRDLMTVRMKRIQHPNAWSQQAEWGTTHLVSNVVIEKVDANGDVHVRSRFQMMEMRRDDLRSFGGTYRHHLKKTATGWKIKLQRTDFFNTQQPWEYVLQIWV